MPNGRLLDIPIVQSKPKISAEDHGKYILEYDPVTCNLIYHGQALSPEDKREKIWSLLKVYSLHLIIEANHELGVCCSSHARCCKSSEEAMKGAADTSKDITPRALVRGRVELDVLKTLFDSLSWEGVRRLAWNSRHAIKSLYLCWPLETHLGPGWPEWWKWNRIFPTNEVLDEVLKSWDGETKESKEVRELFDRSECEKFVVFTMYRFSSQFKT
jgi:hypothetical protein